MTGSVHTVDQENVSANLTVAVPAATVFAVLTNPAAHCAIDGTGWVQEPVDDRLVCPDRSAARSPKPSPSFASASASRPGASTTSEVTPRGFHFLQLSAQACHSGLVSAYSTSPGSSPNAESNRSIT